MSGRSRSPFLCLGLICVSVCVCVCVVQLNALHSELANQMADSMVFPLIQFREKDLTGIEQECVGSRRALWRYHIMNVRNNEKRTYKAYTPTAVCNWHDCEFQR